MNNWTDFVEFSWGHSLPKFRPNRPLRYRRQAISITLIAEKNALKCCNVVLWTRSDTVSRIVSTSIGHDVKFTL